MKSIYVDEHFLEEDLCTSIIKDAEVGGPSLVNTKEAKSTYQPDIRNSQEVLLDRNIGVKIRSDLKDLVPVLIEKFGEEVDEMSPLNTLKYTEGHFFRKHSDNSIEKYGGRRTLTALIYLNSNIRYGPSNNSFDGGELIIYGAHEQFPYAGLPIFPKMGKLIVFPSRLVHEVKPVISGSRFCIASWYLK